MSDFKLLMVMLAIATLIVNDLIIARAKKIASPGKM